MKKIFTLAIGSLFALSVMAADHKPSVTIKSNSNYRLVIDGKSYRADNYIDLSGVYPGYHSIKVYEVSQHRFFKKKAKLVDASDFAVKGNDIVINIDRYGKIDINESAYRNERYTRKSWNKEKQDRAKEPGYGRQEDPRDSHRKKF